MIFKHRYSLKIHSFGFDSSRYNIYLLFNKLYSNNLNYNLYSHVLFETFWYNVDDAVIM